MKKGVRFPPGASKPVRRLCARRNEPPRVSRSRSEVRHPRRQRGGAVRDAEAQLRLGDPGSTRRQPHRRQVRDHSLPEGNGAIKGYLVRPANADKLPAVLVVHENRGLNPYIEDVARRLALANFIAFAPDGLTSVGGYPGDDEKGAELFRRVDPVKMQEDFAAAARWLKSLPDFDRQARRDRLLFRRRGRQSARGALGFRSRRRRAVLWRAA